MECLSVLPGDLLGSDDDLRDDDPDDVDTGLSRADDLDEDDLYLSRDEDEDEVRDDGLSLADFTISSSAY